MTVDRFWSHFIEKAEVGETGDFVRHSDYAALEAECEGLRADVRTATEKQLNALRVASRLEHENTIERGRAEALEARLAEAEKDRDAFREIALEVASVSNSGADTVSFLIHLNQIAKKAALAISRGGKADG